LHEISTNQTYPGPPIHTLQPLQESLPAPTAVVPSSSKRPAQIWHSQNQWLTKAVPEAGPASGMLASLNRMETQSVTKRNTSTLMAVGVASDRYHASRREDIRIFAAASGEAGNLLHLIKPRIESLGWNEGDNIELQVLNPASSEESYWLGNGGPIEQITFARDIDGLTSWLAVRTSTGTAILRPVYNRIAAPSTLPNYLAGRYPTSRLSPNPISTLDVIRTGGRPHSDVSFNPWYIKQFAVVDHRGYWSVWDLEGQQRKRKTFKPIPGKSGHVHDGLIPEPGFKLNASIDGWGRILWAGSVSTLVVSERRTFSVFSLQGEPKRLSSPGLIDLKSADWILDIKRSLTRHDQIFVLTTSQIFWIQINAVGLNTNEINDHIGARILLSHRHFRDTEDDTQKIELLQEHDGMLTVSLRRSKLIQYSMHCISLLRPK
jgi:RNA polymerase I-specific transcription initiation factor RRN6